MVSPLRFSALGQSESEDLEGCFHGDRKKMVSWVLTTTGGALMGHSAEFSQQLLSSCFLGQEPDTRDKQSCGLQGYTAVGTRARGCISFSGSNIQFLPCQWLSSWEKTLFPSSWCPWTSSIPMCRRCSELWGRILGRGQSRKLKNPSHHLDHSCCCCCC